MFDHIHNVIQSIDTVETTTVNRNSPTDGMIYLRLETDTAVSSELQYFQPENSAVAVENGEIVEFDIRLGKWEPEDRDATMTQIQSVARSAARETCIYLTRVDQGGVGGFVPHVRCWDGPIPVEPFAQFLDSIGAEIDFLQTHDSV